MGTVTITAIAKELNTTPMTIYRRLKKAGVKVEDLRDEQNEITPAGASIIASMFTPQTTEQAVEQAVKGDGTGDARTDAAILRAKLDGAEALIAALTDERDQLRRQLQAMTDALEREQADRGRERQLLTGGDADGEPRRRWFQWWKR